MGAQRMWNMNHGVDSAKKKTLASAIYFVNGWLSKFLRCIPALVAVQNGMGREDSAA